MQVFELVKNKQAADFWLEDQAFEGVKRVAGKAAGDVEKVTGGVAGCSNFGWDGDNCLFAGNR